MADFDRLTAEELIAALVVSYDGELSLKKEAFAVELTGLVIQIVEIPAEDRWVFRLVNKEDVDGLEALPDRDSSHGDLS